MINKPSLGLAWSGRRGVIPLEFADYCHLIHVVGITPCNHCAAFQSGRRPLSKSGQQADQAILRRMHRAHCKIVDEYVAAAIRTIDDESWRAHCAEIVHDADLDSPSSAAIRGFLRGYREFDLAVRH